MAIFGTSSSSSPRGILVPPFVVWVSRVSENVDPTGDPTFANWDREPRLKVNWLLRGSSVAGASAASLSAASGPPHSTQVPVQDSAAILKNGDRVAIGADEGGGSPRWLWAGYIIRVNLNISARESCSYTAIGPEWVWGGNGPGSYRTVCGQLRRVQLADDDWVANEDYEAVGTIDDWVDVWSTPCVFNPGGRPNASIGNAVIDETTDPDTEARLWEEPDRKNAAGVALSQLWTRREIARTLIARYNYPASSGIAMPDFGTVGVPNTSDVRDVNLDGLTLWQALQRAIGPDWGFFISNIPTGIADDNNAWQGFQLHYFARNRGDAAELHLNPIGTAPGDAIASVTALDVTGDISKSITRVRVLGRRLRHIRLYYNGGETAVIQNDCLQHGWPSDIDLSGFADTDGNITPITIDSKTELVRKDWYSKGNARGAEFHAYRHVFRYFVWNECGEWIHQVATPPHKYGPTEVITFTPDVAAVLGDGADATARRRRPLVDSQYIDSQDGFRRLRPTLFFAIKEDGVLGDWIQVPGGSYRIDPDRAAVWITVEDLAAWKPFDVRDKAAADANTPETRSFATLLNLGLLRMCLIASVECDVPLEADAERAEDAGSPYVREHIVRRGDRYYQTTAYASGGPNPITLAAALVDDAADATTEAQMLRSAGQDILFHASIQVAADWPYQAIGRTVSEITGRSLSLSTGGTRAAQIVAARMDVASMKWELLTESAVKAMVGDRGRGRRVKRWDGGALPMQGEMPDLTELAELGVKA